MNRQLLVFLSILFMFSFNAFLLAQTTETFNSVSTGTYAAGAAVGAFTFSSDNGLGAVVESGLGSGGSNGVYADFNNGATNTLTVKRVGGVAFDFISVYLDDENGFGSATYDVEGYLSTGKKYGPQSVNVSTAGIHTFNWTNIDEIRFLAASDVAATFDNIVYTVSPTPVELVFFTAKISTNIVELNWQTATEVNNYGFEVQKSEVSSQNSEGSFKKIGFVQGNGTSNSPKEYSFVDPLIPNLDQVSYRLKQIDNDGTFTYSKIITVDLTTLTNVENLELPKVYSVSQNYPNPFNPSTTISYQVPKTSQVKIEVYNSLGQLVATLANSEKNIGEYQVQWDGSEEASGIYFARMTTPEYSSSIKMMLVK